MLIWAGVATIYLRGGLPLGIDFTGGTAVVLSFPKPTDEAAVRRALGELQAKETVVQRYVNADKNDVIYTCR